MIQNGFFIGGTFLSAAALYLGFNLHDYSWSWAFVALIPLLALAERSRTCCRAGAVGLLAGFSFYFIELFWITNSIAGFTSLPRI
ncbi:MAG: hypothetical protein J7M09_00860, partial [Deltaproteobacteria bacterium]|nr:hypothetical protein [Candidatus Tharpella sp.]